MTITGSRWASAGDPLTAKKQRRMNNAHEQLREQARAVCADCTEIAGEFVYNGPRRAAELCSNIN